MEIEPAAVDMTRDRRTAMALGVLLAAGLLLAHLQPLLDMVNLWYVSPMYSYAFTVPIISAFLLWSRRLDFANLTPAGSWRAAGPVLAVGIVLLVGGRAAGVLVIQQVAFVVSLLGVVLAVFGPAYLRTGWAGFAYLFLMVPVWDGLTEQLHAPFQDRSAVLAVVLMRAAGIPAHRDGLFIDVPGASFEVARACSGVNYLVAVVALGLPLAYLYLHSHWRRAVLLTGAVLVAAFSNGIRVGLIGAMAYYGFGTPLHGPFHVLHGLFVAGMGYLALFAGLGWLSRTEAPTPRKTLAEAPGRPRRLRLSGLASLTVLFWVVASGPYLRGRSAVPAGVSLQSMPSRLENWTGTGFAKGENDVSRWWPGADEELRRRYVSPDGAQVDVFIAYFRAQQQHRRLATFHASELHAPADQVNIVGSAGGTFSANRVRLPAPDNRQSVFWYVIEGDTEAGRYSVALRTAWHALTRGRSSGAAVMVTASNAETSPELEKFAALLQNALHPLLDSAFPGPAMTTAKDGAPPRLIDGVR